MNWLSNSQYSSKLKINHSVIFDESDNEIDDKSQFDKKSEAPS